MSPVPPGDEQGVSVEDERNGGVESNADTHGTPEYGRSPTHDSHNDPRHINPFGPQTQSGPAVQDGRYSYCRVCDRYHAPLSQQGTGGGIRSGQVQ
jgi:hypothetical protein